MLRETIAQWQRTAADIADLQAKFPEDELPAAIVPDTWRQKRVLAQATIRLTSGHELLLYEDPVRLTQTLKRFARALDTLGIATLDTSTLRSRNRVLSQLLSRDLYNRGAAGIAYRSIHPPGGTCVALFEGRASLERSAAPRPLDEPFRALREVCREFDVKLSEDLD